jgi:hypothetical protein
VKYILSFVVCAAALVLILSPSSPGPVRSSTASSEEPRKKEPDVKGQLEELRAEVKKLQELVPDQAAIMSHVGYHWSNLWFAIEREHWTLADFYLSETRNNVKWAVRAKPFRKVGKDTINLGEIAQALDNAQFTEMKLAIGKKDKEACIKLYDGTLSICYGCHKASDKPYLRPQRPTAPEVRAINFDPNAKYPQ